MSLSMGAITDVGGVRVGPYHRLCADASLGSGGAPGTTVVVTPPGPVGAVDGRGGGPGTRGTEVNTTPARPCIAASTGCA